MANITSAIRSKGMTVGQFCEKVLETDYKSFRWRVRNQRLRLSEIKQIIVFTNLTFEELFMDHGPVEKPTPKEGLTPVKETEEPNQDDDSEEDFIDTFN